MAVMYPSDIKPTIRSVSRAEEVIFDKLKTELPDDLYQVVWSFLWVDEDVKREADFVVVHRDKPGFLLLEVKGGRVKFENNTWSQKNEGEWHVIDPVAQARESMFHIVKKVSKHHDTNEDSWGRIGLVFPDVYLRNRNGPSFGGVHSHQILDARDCKDICRSIQDLFDKEAPPSGRSGRKPRDENSKILEVIRPRHDFAITLKAQIKEERESWKRLTDQQLTIVRHRSSTKRLMVDGVAGSGKTIVAMEAARRAAKEGCRVLYLCYNSDLQSEVFQQLIPRNRPPSFDISAYTIGAVKSNMNDIGKFDAIFIDEGQDLFENDWMKITSLLQNIDDGKLWIFYDPAQTIIGGNARSLVDCARESGWLDDTSFHEIIRNTVEIGTYASNIIHSPAQFLDGASQGTEVVTKKLYSSRELQYEILKHINHWINRANLAASRIVVIHTETPSAGMTHATDAIKQLCENRQDERQGEICPLLIDVTAFKGNTRRFSYSDLPKPIYTSSHACKGLEADAAILVACSDLALAESEVITYIAATRAQHVLVVLEVPISFAFLCKKFWEYTDKNWRENGLADNPSECAWREIRKYNGNKAICVSLRLSPHGVEISLRNPMENVGDKTATATLNGLLMKDVRKELGFNLRDNGPRFFIDRKELDMHDSRNWKEAVNWLMNMSEHYLFMIDYCFELSPLTKYIPDELDTRAAPRSAIRQYIASECRWRNPKEVVQIFEDCKARFDYCDIDIVSEEMAEANLVVTAKEKRTAKQAATKMVREIEMIAQVFRERSVKDHEEFRIVCIDEIRNVKKVHEDTVGEISHKIEEIAEKESTRRKFFNLCYDAVCDRLGVRVLYKPRLDLFRKLFSSHFPELAKP